jgi:phosphoesterase RecJ-like protein
MNGAGAKDEDLDGLVNYMRNIEGVDVGILFREIDEQTTKVSFRSRGTFNSAAVLACLGGGGHAAAAGATIALPLNETRAVVLDHLPAVLEGLK